MRIVQKFNEYKEECAGKSDSEALFMMRDLVRCSSHFKTVEELEAAFKKLTADSQEQIAILKVKPKLDTDLRNITIHLCIKSLVPIIGEVQLKFGEPATLEMQKANHFLYEIERADGLISILSSFAKMVQFLRL